jgi:hypothetical protein
MIKYYDINAGFIIRAFYSAIWKIKFRNLLIKIYLNLH